MKFSLQKHNTHHLHVYGSWTDEVLEWLHPTCMFNAVQPVIRFRPRVSLYDNPCPMFVVVQEPEIQSAGDQSSPNPTLPTYSVWNQHGTEKFLYLQALALCSTLFNVNSLLLTKDMLCQKLPVPCGVQ